MPAALKPAAGATGQRTAESDRQAHHGAENRHHHAYSLRNANCRPATRHQRTTAVTRLPGEPLSEQALPVLLQPVSRLFRWAVSERSAKTQWRSAAATTSY